MNYWPSPRSTCMRSPMRVMHCRSRCPCLRWWWNNTSASRRSKRPYTPCKRGKGNKDSGAPKPSPALVNWICCKCKCKFHPTTIQNNTYCPHQSSYRRYCGAGILPVHSRAKIGIIPCKHRDHEQVAQIVLTRHNRYRVMSNKLHPNIDPSQPVVYQIKLNGQTGLRV